MMEAKSPLIKFGWLRALIYFIGAVAVIILLQMTASFLLPKLGLTGNGGNTQLMAMAAAYTLSGIGIFLFTYAMRRVIDRKSFITLGFAWKEFTDEAALGFFIAIALLGIGSLVLVGLGYLTFLTISIQPIPLFIELELMLMAAFVEEVMFRGYLLHNLMQSMNKWVSLLISAVLFGLVHSSNPDVTVLAIVNVFLAGLFLGLNYIYTKNLWFSICFHFAWNFLQGPVFGYDVSGLKMESLFHQSLTGPELWTGGPFGFEGSILCPLLLILSIVGLAFGFKRKYLPS